MKRFIACSAVLALAFIVSWIDFVPVRCGICRGEAFRTNITSLVFGGYDSVVHAHCMDEYAGTTWTKPAIARPIQQPLQITAAVEEMPNAG